MAPEQWWASRERDGGSRRGAPARLVALVVGLVALAGCGSSSSPETKVLGVEYERPRAAPPAAAAHPEPATGALTPSVAAAGRDVGGAPAAAAPSLTPPQPAAPAPAAAVIKAPAAATAAPAPAAPAPPGSVAGVVLAAGAPLPGARVALAQEDTRVEASTDAAGSYRIDGLAPGDYRLEVLDPGDSTPACDSAGTCITTRPAQAEVRQVAVAAGAITEANISF